MSDVRKSSKRYRSSAAAESGPEVQAAPNVSPKAAPDHAPASKAAPKAVAKAAPKALTARAGETADQRRKRLQQEKRAEEKAAALAAKQAVLQAKADEKAAALAAKQAAAQKKSQEMAAAQAAKKSQAKKKAPAAPIDDLAMPPSPGGRTGLIAFVCGLVAVAAAAAVYAIGYGPAKLTNLPAASLSEAASGKRYAVSVRVVNGDDGKPVPGIGLYVVTKQGPVPAAMPKGGTVYSGKATSAESDKAYAAEKEDDPPATDASGCATVVAGPGQLLRAWKPAWLEGTARVSKDSKSIEIVAYNWHYQWPKFGYDDARTNYNPWFTINPPYKLAWDYDAKTLLEYPVSAYKGRIVATNGRGRIFCLNAKNGRELWRHEIKAVFAAQPALDGRRAYVSGMDNKLYAVRMTDGKVLWKHTTGGPIESSPLLDNDNVYIGSWDRSFYAIDKNKGRQVWRFRTGGAVKGTAALWGNRLYIGSYDGNLYCLDRRNGRQIWRSYVGGTVYSSPAVDVETKRVYIGSTAGYLKCLDAVSGDSIWKHMTGNTSFGVYSSPALGHGRVFFGSYDGMFYACDARTGALDWTFDGKGSVSGSPAVIGDIVYVASFGGRTWGLNAHTGKVLWEFGDGRYTPATANGEYLYVVGHHRLYAFKGKRKYL